MVSAIYILHKPHHETETLHFELLLHRGYHNDLPDNSLIVSLFDKSYKRIAHHERCPFIYYQGINFVYITGGQNIFLLAVSRRNTDAMTMVTFLHNFFLIMCQYLCVAQIEAPADTKDPKKPTIKEEHHTTYVDVTKLNKEVIIDNFVLIYELLDECMDFGVVQLTDYNILKEYIKLEANLAKKTSRLLENNEYELSDSDSEDDGMSQKDKKKKAQKKIKNTKSTHNQAVNKDLIDETNNLVNSSILRTSSLAISWRPKGIFYAKNEIYIDIVENCDFYYDFETDVIKTNEILGSCYVKSYLSGMPVCKLGFNERNISSIGNDSSYGETDDNEEPDTNTEEGEERKLSEGKEKKGTLSESEDKKGTLSDAIEETLTEAKDKRERNLSETQPETILEGQQTTEHTITPKSSIDNPSDNQFDTVADQVPEDIPDNQLKGLEEEEEEDDEQVTKRKKRRVRIPIRDVQFHQCIKLGSIYKNNIVYFTPPDDRFTLMTYHVEQLKRNKKPLFMIQPTFRVYKLARKVQVLCIINTNFKKRLHCKDLLIRIPINPKLFRIKYNKDNEDDLKYKAEIGDVSYKVDASELFWSLDNVDGSKKTIKMMAELLLHDTDHIDEETTANSLNHKFSPEAAPIDNEEPEPEINEAKMELDKYYGVNGASTSIFDEVQKNVLQIHDHNHISLTFNIPNLTYSGLRLNYLRVDEDQMKYTCFPWVRYLTQSELHSNNASSHCNYRFKLSMSNYQILT